MSDLYGEEFLSRFKSKRTKYITIPIRDTEGKTFDTYDLKSDEVDELIKPL